MKKIKIERYTDIPKHYTGIVEFPGGTKEWFLNREQHRTDGPAVIWPDGTKIWYLNGKRHRENGPAVIWPNGTKMWFLNGKRHRTDGPAIELPDGRKEYWLNGEFLNEDKINQFIEQFDYPVETAIKLTYWLETNKS